MKHNRMFAAVAALLILVLLVGCGGKTGTASGSTGGKEPVSSASAGKTDTPAPSGGSSESAGTQNGGGSANADPVAANPDAYVFRSGSVDVPVSVEAAAVLAALGTEKGYFEAESCAGLGTERYYIYGGFQVMSVEYYDKIVIGSVYLIDDTVSTPEGVSLGDSLDRVKAVYGEPAMTAGNELTYVKGNCNLVFVFSDGVLVSVEYQANDIYD